MATKEDVEVRAKREKRKADLVAAYLRGDKTFAIQKAFPVGPGELYRVLREAKVPLRSKDPNHPASSMALRNPTLRTPTMQKLLELSHAEVAYFKEQLASLQKEAPEQFQHASDAYIQTWVEYNDELVERMNLWIKALGDDGASVALVAFKEAIQTIRNMSKEIDKEEDARTHNGSL